MHPGCFALGKSICQSSPSSTFRPRLPKMKSPHSPSGQGASGWDQGHLGTRASLLYEAAREGSASSSRLHTSRCRQLSYLTHLWGKELLKPRPTSESENSSAVCKEKPKGALTHYISWGFAAARWCGEPWASQNCATVTQEHLLSVAAWLHIFIKNVKHPPGTHLENTKAFLHQVVEALDPADRRRSSPGGTWLTVALGPGSWTRSTLYPASLGQRRLLINVLFCVFVFPGSLILGYKWLIISIP